ncbi:GAF domain-containing protein [Thermocatellispora tengchongensis]|uniref:GAF domain-containing protein n=1 Tax=Thermocatellispora tengchongensis TaxID=1073253 RepID=A0A840PEE7_9ACTN|nr:hypothetical protein [Thermocatellispora tengchongensis]MBB5135830.1 GAF domain-containing protein [Thermocatellispora tengchongensis]
MGTSERARPAPGREPLRVLIERFAGHDPDDLAATLVTAAATLCGTGCGGLVEVVPADEHAFPVHTLTPPGDPLDVRRWLADSGVLKMLAAGSDPVLLPRDPALNDPGFLGVPLPLGTRRQAYLWVAGRRFGEQDEDLLVRFAAAAARALEAASGFEAAARLLRAVHAFAPVPPQEPPPRPP